MSGLSTVGLELKEGIEPSFQSYQDCVIPIYYKSNVWSPQSESNRTISALRVRCFITQPWGQLIWSQWTDSNRLPLLYKRRLHHQSFIGINKSIEKTKGAIPLGAEHQILNTKFFWLIYLSGDSLHHCSRTWQPLDTTSKVELRNIGRGC